MSCKYCRHKNPVPLIDHDMVVKPYVDEYLSGTLTIIGKKLVLQVDSWNEGGFEVEKDIGTCPVCHSKLEDFKDDK